jgi:hypothetical protein
MQGTDQETKNERRSRAELVGESVKLRVMATSTASERTRSIPGAVWLLAGALFSLAIITLLVWLITGVGLVRLIASLRGGAPVVQASQPTVVRQIQQLQRLETVRYTMDKIISGERDSAYLPKFLVSDRLLLVVHGEVIGGVDLSKLRPSDVTVQGRTVTVHLPNPEILVTRVDNAKTRVYSRDTGLFSSPDPNLESEVREEAERQLQQAAQQDGILKAAADDARSALITILKGWGFERVEFS